MTLLPVERAADPWCGPRVFDDAQQCPAKAATALHGWAAPRTRLRTAPMGGAWLATVTLLERLVERGPTSAFVRGDHPVTDLHRLAAQTLHGQVAEVRAYAAATAEQLLHAQADTGTAGVLRPGFRKVPYGSGHLHGGGVLAFDLGGGVWQAWRLRTGAGSSRAPTLVDEHWALTAAWVVSRDAQGMGRPVTRVDVLEHCAHDGVTIHLAGWTRDQLEARFAELRDGELDRAARDLAVRPGAHCSSCAFVGACPACPSVNGLLHGVPTQPYVRQISAGHLRMHAACPWRYRLTYIEGLPADSSVSAAMQRGALVDQWLTNNHRRAGACSPADLTTLDAHDDELLSKAAGGHLDLCPQLDAAPGSLTVQPAAAAVDAASGVLLVARPDASFLDSDGRVVWRETKTRGTVRTTDATLLVTTDLTAALYLVLLAGLHHDRAGAVEWEQLSHSGAELTVLSADDSDLVEAARSALSSAVADLVGDTEYPPRPGVTCRACPQEARCQRQP